MIGNAYYKETDERREALFSTADKCLDYFAKNNYTVYETKLVMEYINEALKRAEAINVFQYDGKFFQKD